MSWYAIYSSSNVKVSPNVRKKSIERTSLTTLVNVGKLKFLVSKGCVVNISEGGNLKAYTMIVLNS
jgi:hypothetical protein